MIFNSLFRIAKICCRVTCIHAGVEQPAINFNKNTKKKDGLQDWCKDCFKEVHKEWLIKNPEKSRQIWHEWVIKNPEKRSANIARHIARRKERAEVLKEMGITSFKRFTFGWATCAVWRCKERASEKGVPFDMKASDLLDPITDALPVFCPIFPHIRLDYDAGSDRRCWASVDRIVPALGYTTGNVRVISLSANVWKSNGSNAAERERIVEIMRGKIKSNKINNESGFLFSDMAE